MTRNKSIKIIAVSILSLIVLCELGYIVKRNIFDSSPDIRSGIAGAVTDSGITVKINNEEIPSYKINGSGNNSIYFSADDLSHFGFTISDSDESYSISRDGNYSVDATSFSDSLNGAAAYTEDKPLYSGTDEFSCCSANDVLLIPDAALNNLGQVISSASTNTIYYAFGTEDEIAASLEISNKEISAAESSGNTASSTQSPDNAITLESATVIVLDPGHGKSSSEMSSEEKSASGWVQNSSGQWGEWRHYKSGSSTEDCKGSGCTGRVTPNGACWYPIGNGDRATEPDINLKNALAAKSYLENMGYEVRMTRTSNDENPSITRRVSYCYPNNDTSQEADAEMFVCIHSNAGGGSGSAYISLEGLYDQRGLPSDYVEQSNKLGQYINDCIVSDTSLGRSGNGIISFEPELIAFCKSPVPCGYLEIGFFDNSSDLAVLQSESDAIGKAIAEGINLYYTENVQ